MDPRRPVLLSLLTEICLPWRAVALVPLAVHLYRPYAGSRVEAEVSTEISKEPDHAERMLDLVGS